MPYTLWSRGRLIGHTDLGFVRCLPRIRTGWLHPTPEGELVHAELERSTEAADRSAFHDVEALDLQLRHADGSLIETEGIGVVDTHRLLERGREFEELDDWNNVDDFLNERGESERQLEEDIEHDVKLIEEWFSQSDGFSEWAIDELDETKFPRYQIHVELCDDAAIP